MMPAVQSATWPIAVGHIVNSVSAMSGKAPVEVPAHVAKPDAAAIAVGAPEMWMGAQIEDLEKFVDEVPVQPTKDNVANAIAHARDAIGVLSTVAKDAAGDRWSTVGVAVSDAERGVAALVAADKHLPGDTAAASAEMVTARDALIKAANDFGLE